jgi:hypothetical protein
MMPHRVALIGLILACACSSPPPPRKVEANYEPKVAEDLPTWCSDGQKPCVPPRDFAARLCRGQFAGAALFLFQKQSPWQRRWVNAKAGLPARNSEGGPAGGALVHGEELLVMAESEAAEASASTPRGKKSAKKPEPDILALRWDGTCVSLKGAETVTRMPAAPKNAAVEWAKLDPFVQRSLVREAALERDVAERDKACTSGASPDCQKAEQTLSISIVMHVRRGTKLSMPEQRP